VTIGSPILKNKNIILRHFNPANKLLISPPPLTQIHDMVALSDIKCNKPEVEIKPSQ
jgi:hypothetical protein